MATPFAPRPQRVYISGPMTGYKEFNFPAFFAAEERLRVASYDPVNPARLNPGPHPPANALPSEHKAYHQQCLRADIRALCDCDLLALMPGWELSDGAQLELHIAHRLGIKPCLIEQLLGA